MRKSPSGSPAKRNRRGWLLLLAVLGAGCSREALLETPRLIPRDYPYYFSLEGGLFYELAGGIPHFPLPPRELKHLKGTERVYGGAGVGEDGRPDYVITLQGSFPAGLLRTALKLNRSWEREASPGRRGGDYWSYHDPASGELTLELAPFSSRSLYFSSGRMEEVLEISLRIRADESPASPPSSPPGDSPAALGRPVLAELEIGDLVILAERRSLEEGGFLRDLLNQTGIEPTAVESLGVVFNRAGPGLLLGFLHLTFQEERQARAFITTFRLLQRVPLPPGGEGIFDQSRLLRGRGERQENRVYLRGLTLTFGEIEKLTEPFFTGGQS